MKIGTKLRRWSKEEIEILKREYKNGNLDELSVRINRTRLSIGSMADILGLRRDRSFDNNTFKKGMTAWNKGTKGVSGVHPNSVACQFKKGCTGNVHGRPFIPLYGTTISAAGTLMRKISKHPTIWKSVHSTIWENNFGDIPAGMIIRFRKGLKTTVENQITVDKLECVSKVEHMKRNAIYTNYPKEMIEIISAKAQLTKEINRRKAVK